MHDTRLHSDPEEFVFVRRSAPLTGFVSDTTGVQVNGLNLFGVQTGLAVYSRLYDGPKAKNNFDDEPSKSTEQ